MSLLSSYFSDKVIFTGFSSTTVIFSAALVGRHPSSVVDSTALTGRLPAGFSETSALLTPESIGPLPSFLADSVPSSGFLSSSSVDSVTVAGRLSAVPSNFSVISIAEFLGMLSPASKLLAFGGGLPSGSLGISTSSVASAALNCEVPPSLVDSVMLTGRLHSDA